MAELPLITLDGDSPVATGLLHVQLTWLPCPPVSVAFSSLDPAEGHQPTEQHQGKQRSGHHSSRSFFTMHRKMPDGSSGCQDRGIRHLFLARFHARVQVQLRPSVLDPAGEATRAAAGRLGVEGLQTLRIGKAVELSLDADSEDQARQQVQLLCDRLLANPVTENWTMSLEEQKA